MIFLYRFDVLALDGVVSNPGWVGLLSEGVLDSARTTYSLTNQAAPYSMVSVDIPFLPAVASTGEVFLPTAIEHEQIRLDGEKNAGQLRVSLPLDHALAQLYALDSPAVQTWLTLYQADNAVAGGQTFVIWVGQVVSAQYDESRCTLTLDHLQKVLNRPGLTAKHPRSCGHLLFDAATCGVKASTLEDGYWAFREDGFLESVSADGFVVSVPAAANRPAGWLDGGYLVIGGTYTDIAGIDHRVRGQSVDADMQVFGGIRRSIVSHSGGTLRLAVPLKAGEAVGARVSLFAGCDGSLSTCKNKFSNAPRFGGYPYIPIKNPFEVGLKQAAGA